MAGTRQGRRSERRLRGVDGLRAVAAVSVLVYHVWRDSAPDGEPIEIAGVDSVAPHMRHGVTLFFVLSGFLLFRPFAAAAIEKAPLPRLRRYFVNRALRILPAYWVILVVTGLVLDAALLRGPPGDYYVGELALDNLLVCAALIQNYSDDTLYTGIAPAWSLAVEALWYLVLPLLALLAAFAAARARSAAHRAHAALVPAALMIAVAITGKAAVIHFVDWTAGVESSFWSTADFFAYGMIVAVLSIELEAGRLHLPRWWRGAAMGVIAAIVLAVALFGENNLEPGGGRSQASNAAMAIICALLLALVVLSQDGKRDSRLVRLLDARAVVAVGVASYSLFLWNDPISLWLREHGLTADGALGLASNLLLVGAVSGALSALTYNFVERPALRRRLPWRTEVGTRSSPEQARAAP